MSSKQVGASLATTLRGCVGGRGFPCTKAVATGDNLVAVWYVRPATVSGAWDAKTWDSTDQWDAIKTVKAEAGIADGWDSYWPTSDSPTFAAALPAKAYSKGFLATDALGVAVNSQMQRDAYVEALTEWGAKVADLNFEKMESGCGDKPVLNAIAETVGAAASSPTMTLEAEMTLFNTTLAATCEDYEECAQPPATPAPTVIPGTTIPMPANCVTLNSPANWQSSLLERDPPSDTVGACCYKQRYMFFVMCRRTNWRCWWAFGLIRYSRMEVYEFYDRWCCNNPNMILCPDAPTCPHTPPATLPPPGVTPVGPIPYYP
ncbi:MAG: hypothetical protein K2Q09_05310 [Phycisphaerales bacterium]|nr:hypothetical protein [Phycisphaerales bacterium]